MTNLVLNPDFHQIIEDEPSSRYTNSFTEQQMAKASLNAYLSDWEDFCIWCNENQRKPMPASAATVADYLEDRATNSFIGISGKKRELQEKPPLKWNSIDRRLTAISKVHAYNGHPFSRKDPAIKGTLQGMKRSLSQNQPHQIIEDRKSALLTTDINKMIESLPNNLQGKRDRAILLVGFVGALRRSELASIQIEHLKSVPEGYTLFLPWSKTGQREVVIPYGSNLQTCPVRALKEWITIANINSGAVFRSVNRHNQIQSKELSDKAITLIINRNQHIKETVLKAELNKTLDTTTSMPSFGGHSLRAGFATQAHLNGASERDIMLQGGWKKRETLDKYIRETDKWKNNAASKLGL